MVNTDDIEFTDEEIEKVNTIISGIQSDLNKAIDSLRIGKYDEALSFIDNGISKSNCPMCKKELGILKADIVHNSAVCILGADTCKEENTVLIQKANELKNDFIPIKTTKKAKIIKKQEMEAEAREKTNFRLFPPLPPFPFIRK